MAGMNMSRAFNSKMLVKLIKYRVEEGYFNENNDWVEGATRKSIVRGVMISGNRFSQFEEGLARVSEDGGIRFSDYKTLHIPDRYDVKMEDKIFYKGKYFNVLQQSDETEFNFKGFILEKSEGWKP